MNDQMKRNLLTKKKVIISGLYLVTLIIFFLGVFFGAYSLLNKITFQVMNAAVPGIVFGMLVAYLGVRYFLQVLKFKTEFYQSTSGFSWSNFKRNKSRFSNILK